MSSERGAEAAGAPDGGRVAACLTGARLIGRARSVEEVCAGALEAIDLALGPSGCAVLLPDAEGRLRCAASRRAPEAFRTVVERYVPWTARSAAADPIVVRQAAHEPPPERYAPLLSPPGVAAVVLAPLVDGARNTGAVVLSYATPQVPADEVATLMLVASVVAPVLERVRAEGRARASEERLRRATEAPASPSRPAPSGEPVSPARHAVAAATLGLARQLLGADGSALCAFDPDRDTWRVVRCEGVSDAFAHEVVTRHQAAVLAAPSGASESLAVSDACGDAVPSGQRLACRREGVASLLVCPMWFGARPAGALAFCFRHPRAFSQADVRGGQTLAGLAAAAMTTADLYAQLRMLQEVAETARRRASFLADATVLLSQSLDVEQTLDAVARIAVPEIADWCAVDILDAEGRLQRLAAAHVDPAKVDHVRALHRLYPPDPETPGGVYEVIRTRMPALQAAVPAELVAVHARDDTHFRLLSELAPTSYTCVPLLSASGVLGAITFAYAESGRRQSERDLAFAQELAAQAALAIENAFAYQRVNDANRLKDEFLATLSHELRTPLNAILGYVQLLGRGVLDADRSSHAMTVLTRNAEALKQIIEDVLDVSRITRGKLRLNVRAVDLGEIVEAAVGTVQAAADAKGVALRTAVEASGRQVTGDPDRLQQIVWNLLSNAVKFTPRGGTVRVSVAQTPEATSIEVRDTGQGIDPAFLPHLFERFRQADARSSREHGGLGLGLAIVRELVELHGGTVHACSDGLGRGAAFTVRLPRVTAAGDARS